MAFPLAALFGPVVNYFTKRSENKTRIKEKKIDRLVNADDKVAEWEAIQAESGKYSWKDEFWTIVLAIPMIGCFIPGGEEIMINGFNALDNMPDFYQYWLGIAVLAAFGVKMVKR